MINQTHARIQAEKAALAPWMEWANLQWFENMEIVTQCVAAILPLFNICFVPDSVLWSNVHRIFGSLRDSFPSTRWECIWNLNEFVCVHYSDSVWVVNKRAFFAGCHLITAMSTRTPDKGHFSILCIGYIKINCGEGVLCSHHHHRTTHGWHVWHWCLITNHSCIETFSGLVIDE